MIRIVTCLWAGTDLPSFSANQYDERYVDALRAGLERHWPGAELTVLREGDFLADSPGWWRRFEAFAPSRWPTDGGRIVLLDLDMILVGPCSWISEWDESPVGMPLDPYYPPECCSTVITANLEGARIIWEAAQAARPSDFTMFGLPSEMMLLRKLYKVHGWKPLEPEPTRLLSYKKHLKRDRRPWEGSSIVYFHGKPKPHQLPESTLKQAWNSTS